MSWLQISKKIEKAYIIRINTPESIAQADACARSCEEHNVPYEFFEGYMRPEREFIREETGFELNLTPGERGCTASHFKIWQKLINEGITAAIFEHDVIVKRNFIGLEIPDNAYAFLGYRVEDASHYNCPNDDFTIARIYKFEGTHAYAINPITAQACLSKINDEMYRRVNQSIDGFISINNLLGQMQLIVDPTPVVCVVGGNKTSTAQEDGKVARYNESIIPSFYQNIDESVKSKYKMLKNSTRMDF